MSLAAEVFDLGVTQEFLASLDGVANAHVWLSGTKILARVEVYEWSKLSEKDLRGACRRKLGASQTPALLMLERTRTEQDIKSA